MVCRPQRRERITQRRWRHFLFLQQANKPPVLHKSHPTDARPTTVDRDRARPRERAAG
jgi:hypothetical protein